MKTEGLKIIKAEVTNYQNIEHQLIEFDGRNIMIVSGKNESGKSSLLRAIASPVNSQVIPLTPIKKGEEKASVKLKIGGIMDGVEKVYQVDLFFSPQHKKGQLVVSDKEGSKITDRKSMLDTIVGDISFDIMEFIRMAKTTTGKFSKAGVKDQVEILKGFLSVAEKTILHKIATDHAQLMEQRKFAKHDLATDEALLKNSTYTQEDIKKYAEAKDVEIAKDKLKFVEKNQSKYDRYVSFKEEQELELKTKTERVNKLTLELSQLNKEIPEVEAKIESCDKYLEANPDRPTSSAITEEIEEINAFNTQVEKIAEYKGLFIKIKERKETIEKQTADLEQMRSSKAEVFANSKMPVEGLEFTEEAVLFNGLPFNDEHINTAKIIEVGARISMAMNPNLRVITIKDGSLLDKETTAMLFNLVEEKGYQLLMEVVDHEAGDMKIEFVEN